MKEIYQVLAGAMGMERRLDQIANNLANINTTGYKQDRSVFTEYLTEEMDAQGGSSAASGPGQAENSTQPTFPTFSNGYLDTAQGTFQLTGQPLDMAIDGEGYFKVEKADTGETFYTRSGCFTLNSQGELVTVDGNRVLDDAGEAIQLDLKGAAPKVMPDGTIQIGDKSVGQLGLAQFEQPWKLEKYGHNLIKAPAGTEPQSVETPNIRQGALENSNVNAIIEMTRMIEVQRAYQSQMKAMQSLEEISTSRIESAAQ